MKKKIISVLAVVACLAMFLGACGGGGSSSSDASSSEIVSSVESLEESSEESIEESIDESSVSGEVSIFMPSKCQLAEYNAIDLEYALSGADANEIVWTSSNPAIATVVGGKITAVKEGTTIVTATVRGKSASCEVTVLKNESVPVIILDQDWTVKAQPRVGGELQIFAHVRFNSEDVEGFDGFVWSSSNESIATVDENGVIHGVAVGECTITVGGTYNGKVMTPQTIEVSVVNPD